MGHRLSEMLNWNLEAISRNEAVGIMFNKVLYKAYSSPHGIVFISLN